MCHWLSLSPFCCWEQSWGLPPARPLKKIVPPVYPQSPDGFGCPCVVSFAAINSHLAAQEQRGILVDVFQGNAFPSPPPFCAASAVDRVHRRNVVCLFCGFENQLPLCSDDGHGSFRWQCHVSSEHFLSAALQAPLLSLELGGFCSAHVFDRFGDYSPQLHVVALDYAGQRNLLDPLS